MKKEENKENNKSIEKLLMSLLVSNGITTATIGKIVGMSQQNVCKVIPVSDIQKDVKKTLNS